MVCSYSLPMRVYKYPFELVMKAYERRFPRCPQMPIVLDCVITDEERSDDGAYEKTTRRCKLSVDAPYLFKKIIGIEVAYFIQINTLDRRARTLLIEASNETFSSRIHIRERCRYFAHPENPDWTCFDQSTDLDIQNFFGFEKSMEKMGMKQYAATTLKGKEIIEYFITELRNEGITHVDRWEEPDSCNSTTVNYNKDTIIGASSSSSHGSPLSEKTSSTIIQKQGSIDSAATNKSGDGGSDELMILDDSEFIAKNIGCLTRGEEKKLIEFRQYLTEKNLENIPNLTVLYRFLTSRDFHFEKSYIMLKDSLQWHAGNKIDDILTEYQMLDNGICKYFPGGWHHYDKDGRPLYILRLGCMDVKGVLKSIGEDGLLKLTIHICEEGLRLMNESMKHRNIPVWTWSLLIDLEGLSMRHLWRPGIKALLRIIETVEKNYPETMGRVLVVRAPRVFPILWTVVSAFIDDKTKSKFLFYGGPDCVNVKDGLEHYIEPDIIPDFLGGPCKTLIEEGGLIPKAFYKSESADGNHTAATISLYNDQNVYRTAELRPGEYLEVIVKNNEPKSVLTWDFDVLNSDVHFSVFQCSNQQVASQQSKDLYKSVLDHPQLKEGKSYNKVEPSLVCRHTESVQGSHVLDSSDTYILQWMCPPGATENAQLMFFYEKLTSVDYKGSMTSLESGFSVLSVGSCQSR